MQFDYVIVGGGSAGATLAARLSEDTATTVCLIEAGGKGDGILVRAPAAVVAMTGSEATKANARISDQVIAHSNSSSCEIWTDSLRFHRRETCHRQGAP